MKSRVKKSAWIKVCLDCTWMNHSKDDWYCGKCEYHGHSISYINNQDSCKDYDREPVLVFEDGDNTVNPFGDDADGYV